MPDATIPNDAYNYQYSSYYCPRNCSVGTYYEEDRCRMKEQQANLNVIDKYDCSFDPTGRNQGKNW